MNISYRTLIFCCGLAVSGCNAMPAAANDDSGAAQASRPGRPAEASGAAFLTKEEVAAVIGEPVTTIERTHTSRTYKTAVAALETTIEVERHHGSAGAIEAMVAARKAADFLGATPEPVPGLGDEALFGAMSALFVRKGDTVLMIVPPNLLLLAEFRAGADLMNAKTVAEQAQAMARLKQVAANDPFHAGMNGGDATQGAIAYVKASSKKQGTEHEARAREMARALAAKVLDKL